MDIPVTQLRIGNTEYVSLSCDVCDTTILEDLMFVDNPNDLDLYCKECRKLFYVRLNDKGEYECYDCREL